MSSLVVSDSYICTTWLAEKTGKSHRQILMDMRGRFSGKLGCDIDSYKSTYVSAQNKLLPCYRFPIWVAATIMACYDVKAAAEISKKAAESLELIKALESFEIPDDFPDMYVYAIREVSTGNVKIGISKNPTERLKQLQIGNSSHLELAAYMKADNRYKDETAAHKAICDINIRSEWFDAVAVERLPFDDSGETVDE